MTDSPIFHFVADRLERMTDMSDLEAREVLHSALAAALLEGRTLDGTQALLVIERILPDVLQHRNVRDPLFVCKSLAIALKASALSWSAAESPEVIFDRLIRR